MPVCLRRTGRADEADPGNLLAAKNIGSRAILVPASAYRPGTREVE